MEVLTCLCLRTLILRSWLNVSLQVGSRPLPWDWACLLRELCLRFLPQRFRLRLQGPTVSQFRADSRPGIFPRFLFGGGTTLLSSLLLVCLLEELTWRLGCLPLVLSVCLLFGGRVSVAVASFLLVWQGSWVLGLLW
jgi:hypothetical protein